MYLELIDSCRLHLPDIRAFSIHLRSIFTGRYTLQHKWFEESHFQYWLHRLLQNLFIFFSKKEFSVALYNLQKQSLFLLTSVIRFWSKVSVNIIFYLFHDAGPYHIQFINLESKPMDWFLYNRDLHHERVKNTLLK